MDPVLFRSVLFSVGFHLLLMVPLVSQAQFEAPPAFDVERGQVSMELRWLPAPASSRIGEKRAVTPELPETMREGMGAILRTKPGFLKNPAPPYPCTARRNGWQGTVWLQGRIGPSGRPGLLRISQSSGHDLLDQAALGAIRRWRFVPARRGEHRVAQAVEIPVTFKLENREETLIR